MDSVWYRVEWIAKIQSADQEDEEEVAELEEDTDAVDQSPSDSEGKSE